ncbi:hypothetical protein GCM10010324_05200 [Streptomyces hiroshimensis]|uniref:Uncharacterized protein n=1 Tax=Streptomyces hiroshimensis TaxID=66424 RepID=A0ABQ2Y4T5_9ACTN|nr:hypothetical protein GCM10010324_05200 [Streptomyces hiroshimensis]
MDRDIIVRTREDCMDEFWNLVAVLAVQYEDELTARQAVPTQPVPA